jgi:hypothetical protein
MDLPEDLKYTNQSIVVDAPTNQNAYTNMKNKKILTKIRS